MAQVITSQEFDSKVLQATGLCSLTFFLAMVRSLQDARSCAR